MTEEALAGGPYRLEELETIFPWIKWREPVFIGVMDSDDRGYACRVCIANRGLKGSEVADLPKTPEPVTEHIEAEHLQ